MVFLPDLGIVVEALEVGMALVLLRVDKELLGKDKELEEGVLDKGTQEEQGEEDRQLEAGIVKLLPYGNSLKI